MAPSRLIRTVQTEVTPSLWTSLVEVVEASWVPCSVDPAHPNQRHSGDRGGVEVVASRHRAVVVHGAAVPTCPCPSRLVVAGNHLVEAGGIPVAAQEAAPDSAEAWEAGQTRVGATLVVA